MEGIAQLEGNLNSANGGNNTVGSSGSTASTTQGQLVSLVSMVDDEDGQKDGDPRHHDSLPDFKNTEDSSKLGPENLNAELEKTTEVKVLKPWNNLFANKPTGKSTFPSMEDISDRKGKDKANKDDFFVENAHISEDYDSSDSDEDSSNLPPKKKSRVSEKAKENIEENVGSEKEQEKEVEEEAENEQEKEVEGEEGDKVNE
ncbi:uncharacterized protein LOC131859204 [Cryptomeria japonica]|uniref:uncharacterized protein LOC131859204 n=1 Tax=Cryptomeria japonica TaxID=3369 RepID=UPI0027DA1BCE|nr:uncharacterized protein LOC131859204 [Cryptomeria japonica]